MDKEKKIIKRLKEFADLIKKHNYNYHTLDKPKISDQEFDKLVKENDTLEKKYPFLISFSPSSLSSSTSSVPMEQQRQRSAEELSAAAAVAPALAPRLAAWEEKPKLVEQGSSCAQR